MDLKEYIENKYNIEDTKNGVNVETTNFAAEALKRVSKSTGNKDGVDNKSINSEGNKNVESKTTNFAAEALKRAEGIEVEKIL